jgi:16S rRNA (uracil1498-N3)-methyltransferase
MLLAMVHEFALFVPNVFAEIQTSELVLTQATLLHRMTHVLRLGKGERCVIFDGKQAARIELVAIERKSIRAAVKTLWPVRPLQPALTYQLPLLARDALDEAVYAAAAVGAGVIELVTTEHSRRKLFDKELERLSRIAIGACEQAKQYHIPVIIPPVDLEAAALRQTSDYKLLFSEVGQPIRHFLGAYDQKKPAAITLIAGPEAGFSSQELLSLQQRGYNAYALTNTILRSRDVAWVGLGAVQSFLREC